MMFLVSRRLALRSANFISRKGRLNRSFSAFAKRSEPIRYFSFGILSVASLFALYSSFSSPFITCDVNHEDVVIDDTSGTHIKDNGNYCSHENDESNDVDESIVGVVDDDDDDENSSSSTIAIKCDSEDRPDVVAGMNAYGWTPLHAACANGDLEYAKRLIAGSEGPIDINAQDQFNYRMPGALEQVSAMILKRQLEFHSLSYRSTTQGCTALHYAMYSGNKELVRWLFKHGSDPTIKDDKALSPADYSEDPTMNALYAELIKEFEEKKREMEKEERRQFPLEKRLKEVIVGQDGPINSVASAIRRRENGWHDEDRPLVFLFLGSSGIGKTELAKQVAKYIHKEDRKGFIRIDMSEFQTKHEVAKFIGSPPGYVGYEEGGQLTKKLKNSKNKNVVVLLDEVEKAHPDIMTIMLQLFDEGRLTDGQGVTVECKNAIFILTSNLAQVEIADEAENLRNEAKLNQKLIADESSLISRKFQNSVIYPILRSHFKRDEFLGRIDEMLYFLPFNESELKQIVEKELERWSEKAMRRHGMKLEWDDGVVSKLSEGYNIRYGARSIKHEVEKRIVNQIAKAHENDQIADGDSIKIYLDPEEKKIKFVTIPGAAKTKKSKWASWLSS